MPAILKADLKERVAGKRKAWDTEVKARETAATRAVGHNSWRTDGHADLIQAVDAVAKYFKEQPNAVAYFAQVDIGSNVKVSYIASK